MALSIDLNADVGERPEAIADGREDALVRRITSANIACGGHAGDESTMRALVRMASGYGVGIGAHPSYPDRENFGRLEMKIEAVEISRCVEEQVRRLAAVACELGCEPVHVKPHGALYNVAARDAVVAKAVAGGVARWNRKVVLVGLAGSVMLDVWRSEGFRVAAEAFADRVYEPDGSLRSRRHPDAMITDPRKAADQAARVVCEGVVLAIDGSRVPVRAETLCVHGDTPDAIAIIGAIRARLDSSGVRVARLLPAS
ncbi:MAG: 5-oxoprolinase subunit PxpA [Acidobacteriota bacterium]